MTDAGDRRHALVPAACRAVPLAPSGCPLHHFLASRIPGFFVKEFRVRGLGLRV